MYHTYFAPHAALLEYVDSVFIVHVEFVPGAGLTPLYTFVPTHNRFLCFYLEDPVRVKKQGETEFTARARSIIIGPQLTPVMLDLGHYHQAVVVNLKPAGMYRLLGIPMAELVEQDYDAQLVIGPEITELLDRLQEANSAIERNTITQHYLLGKVRQLRPALPFDQAMLALVHASGNLAIEQVAAQACLSLRQFERKSHERLGLPPKLFGRMIRFSHAYKYKESNPSISWNEIAYRCGYFDQMHFIRDFKFFAGFTPGMLKEADIENSIRFRTLEDLFI